MKLKTSPKYVIVKDGIVKYSNSFLSNVESVFMMLARDCTAGECLQLYDAECNLMYELHIAIERPIELELPFINHVE